ncbi:PAQR family membrane homeostasis protein TrhA [Streptosporangium amethystogenes]|uniref:PAQR family membrane homeostasis protein TrhA n=1 Tax=Streptosporangium amethystogenes TaxID=2002 RepID=UPI0004C999F8|nr:hemolysin III family protein [Streptosporangium amethystogenes]
MATTVAETLAESVKPRLRGWLHAGALPVALVAGFVLVALGPTPQARIAAAVYAITSGLLFGISATYHRGVLSPRTEAVLHRLDHANIYLIIAGTYTPFALLALDAPADAVVLGVIWTGAIAGVLFRVLWVNAPRWLSTALYIGLGWTAVFVLPQLVRGAGVVAVALVFLGGVLYTAGGVVYAMKRPDPSPRWFGFHEVFHAFTVAAYLVQYVAVSLVVYAAA